MTEHAALVGRGYKRKTKVLSEKPVPVLLCPPEVLQGMARH